MLQNFTDWDWNPTSPRVGKCGLPGTKNKQLWIGTPNQFEGNHMEKTRLPVDFQQEKTQFSGSIGSLHIQHESHLPVFQGLVVGQD